MDQSWFKTSHDYLPGFFKCDILQENGGSKSISISIDIIISTHRQSPWMCRERVFRIAYYFCLSFFFMVISGTKGFDNQATNLLIFWCNKHFHKYVGTCLFKIKLKLCTSGPNRSNIHWSNESEISKCLVIYYRSNRMANSI